VDVPLLVTIVILTALAFDFTNGFHDTANAMATSIATGALRPRAAVAMSSVLNLAGAFLSVEVAKTISGGIVDDTKITPTVVFAGLVGAIIWNLFTWLAGLPSSSSHALFGGLIGATLAASGTSAVHPAKIMEKVLVPALASPLIAGLIAVLATCLTYRLTRSADGKVRSAGFRAGQIVSAGLVSLAHGTNDAQKTMGVITLTLITTGALPASAGPPIWVVVSAGAAIALGTYLGGWRITYTLGRGLTTIEEQQGFTAQISAATVILTSSHLGFALSTTHVCSGSILGAGLGRRSADVRWVVAGRMLLAWVMTLPAAAVIGALTSEIATTGTIGVVIVVLAGAGVAGGAYLVSRSKPVTADNVVNGVPEAAESSETFEVAA